MEKTAKLSTNGVFSGYLDVKVATKARRGLTPWKAWHKRWCEIIKVDNIETGAELILRASSDGTAINRVVLPRSSTVCRINSRSKQYAFGVFKMGRNQKPLLFLSGNSESNTQKWMSLIRQTLSIASYIPIGSFNFYISLVDNDHSRTAGLSGLFGILSINAQEIAVNDPITGDDKIRWKWHQFHQFHLQAVTNGIDEQKVCVFHTSKEFVAGPGQLYFYCQEAPSLLNLLVSRGKLMSCNQNVLNKRMSQSEGDLNKFFEDNVENCNSRRKRSDSNDSGVRVSLSSSDDSDSRVKNESSCSMIGLMSKTPGGSEDEDDENPQTALILNELIESKLPRGVSGVSLASGVYEEIPEVMPHRASKDSINVYMNGHMVHLYEDPQELLSSKTTVKTTPPPLPPRTFSIFEKSCDTFSKDNLKNIYKYRSRTLPTKDLKRLSQNFNNDTDYMVMSPKSKAKTNLAVENLYVPMSPIANLKSKLENCYMAMGGKRC